MAESIYAGDAGAFKRCTRCQEFKSLSGFNAKSITYDGRRAECRSCQNESNREYASKNSGRLVVKNRMYRKDNPEKAKIYSRRSLEVRRKNGKLREYEAATKEAKKQQNAEWWKNNPHKRKEYNDKYYATPKGRLESCIRSGISSEINRGSKMGRKTFDLLGYSSDELMRHLERHFLVGMSWDNYGRNGWHIDHIIPLSVFNYETPYNLDFRRAWALSNLQPLWEFDNFSKGAKFSGAFQPSLAI